MARLIEGAKKEGALSLYGSSVAEDMNPVTDAFKKKYGIDFQYWRASSENLVQRTVAETPRRPLPGRRLRDSRGRARGAASRKAPAGGQDAAHRRADARRRCGRTANGSPSRLNIFSAAYNTNLVKKDEVPKSYEDLKHPRWKGRLAVEADDVDWFATIVTKMGRDQGVALFRDIVRTNGMSVRKGHTLLSNLVAAGEVPLALTVYSYKPEQQKRAGAPIEPLYLPPVVALGYGPAVARCAPHPHAAVLFHEFMLGDGQEIWAKRDMAVTNPKMSLAAARARPHADRSGRHARQPGEVGRAVDQHGAQAAVSGARRIAALSLVAAAGRSRSARRQQGSSALPCRRHHERTR